MLTGLRQHMKTVLWIVVATFVIAIFAVWGMDLQTPQRSRHDSDVAGLVDGKPISQQAFGEMTSQLYNQLKTQKGEDYAPNDMERSLISDQAWELTVQNRLMQREIEKLHITTVTDDELVAFLRQNPHPSLQTVFKTQDGQFDYQAYLRALADPEVDWTELERWGRSIIPEMKLQTYLLSQVHIPDVDVIEQYRTRNTTMKARYVEILIEKTAAAYEPSDVELRALYDKKSDDFKNPTMRRVRVLEIKKTPTVADEEDVRIRLADVRADIVKGTLDFAEAAKDYSEDDATAGQGGDLGFFKKGDMAPEFENIAFSIKPGEISEPFRTQFGYHILKVEGRKTDKGVEQVRAKHILMKVVLGADTNDSLQTFMRDLMTEIDDKGLEEAAANRKLATVDSEPFPRGMFIKDLGFVPRISSFAFNNKVGSVSYGIEGEQSIYIVKVLEEIPEQVKPLEEVRQQLIEELRSDRDTQAAKDAAEAVRAEMIASGSFNAAARAKNLAIKETPAFKEIDPIPGIGANTPFHVACRYLAVNAVSPPINGGNRFYVITVVERFEPDMSALAAARKEIVETMRGETANRFLANWYQGIRDDAKVEDLREQALR